MRWKVFRVQGKEGREESEAKAIRVLKGMRLLYGLCLVVDECDAEGLRQGAGMHVSWVEEKKTERKSSTGFWKTFSPWRWCRQD